MIDPVTGAGLAEALAGLTAEMAGQSINDAYDERMTGRIDVEDGPQIGYGNWESNKPSISGDTSGSISQGTGATPVDAWNDYVENEPSVTVSETTGGAVSGSKVDTFIYSLVEENQGTAQAAVKAVAPVAIPIQAAVVACAQALGVSMNINEVATTIKDALVDSVKNVTGAVYDSAKETITAWKDELGRLLFPKKVLEAVSDELGELGIGGGDEGTYDAPTGYVSKINGYLYTASEYSHTRSGSLYEYYCTNGGVFAYFQVGNSKRITCISNVQGSQWMYRTNGGEWRRNMNLNSVITTENGVTVYYGTTASTDDLSFQATSYQTDSQRDFSIDMANYVYGGGTPVGGDYPEGTEASEATSYTPATIPTGGQLATSYDEETGDLGFEEVVPIQLTEDPYDSTGSTDDPIDPTDEENTGVLNPPLPLPIPDTKPSNPDVPLVNPAIVDYDLINELVEELANTLDPQAPQSSGLIPVPPLPGITDPITGQTTFPSIIPQSGPGFIHVYNPTPAEFVAFGTWLWVTYADATIDKILNNPFDGVIGAHELYATPNRDGSDNIRSAFLTCPTTAALVTNRYSEIDCGTVIVPEFYGNYLDYSPYSQAYIYLPFIGINEVSIDDIVGHAVNIRYRIDSYSGSCIAMIFVAKGGYQNLCYQFAGSCSVEVPMAGGSQAAIKAGMMQAEAYARAAMIQAGANAVGGIGSALMGNVGGVLSSLSGIASNYAQAQAGVEAAKVANKSSVQHSGQFGASHGAMGEKVPFFIIRNPIQVKVVNYNEDYGFPAHKRVIVGGCRGYLRVREVNVISAHATDEEKMAIEMALKGGVYVS